jgi:hypothetical protein
MKEKMKRNRKADNENEKPNNNNGVIIMWAYNVIMKIIIMKRKYVMKIMKVI